MTAEQPSTPFVLIDGARVKRNIDTLQRYCDAHGFSLRPHIKTHKIPLLGRWQLDAGAKGITCQKISEAKVFADAGFDDILITYNIVGADKLARLRELATQVELSVVADSTEVIEGLADTFADASHGLSVLIECDTGAGRCGVQTPQQALALAQQIAASTGLRFKGLMTYPADNSDKSPQPWLTEAKALLEQHAQPCAVISSGGTPDRDKAHCVPLTTEYRAGTYLYCDRSLLAAGRCQPEDIALHLHTTVVSRPNAERAVIDAGSKALTSDLLGLEGYGQIEGYPEAKITQLSEEHGVVDLSGCDKKPAIGEVLRVIPNHACPVSNLFDHVWLRDGDAPLQALPVAARGCVS